MIIKIEKPHGMLSFFWTFLLSRTNVFPKNFFISRKFRLIYFTQPLIVLSLLFNFRSTLFKLRKL
jgi:hypothetical protein